MAERIGLLVRQKREQYTPAKPTYHNINIEDLDFSIVIGTASQKRVDAGDLFIPSEHIEKLVSKGILEMGQSVGETRFFTETHKTTGRLVKTIHLSKSSFLETLAAQNVLPKIRDELKKIVDAGIALRLRKLFPSYAIEFSKEHKTIMAYAEAMKNNAKKAIQKKPRLLRRR